jgi:4-alpha-glucanotransferase
MEILERASGLILHPTSLPGPYGIGGLGEAARRFVDFLEESRQTLWQILPLVPIGYGNSPYQSPSSFAGNPLLIDPDLLVLDGYLGPEELRPVPAFPGDRVDYEAAGRYKERILHQAFRRFRADHPSAGPDAFDRFCAGEAAWLDDYALYAALRQAFAAGPWPEELVHRRPPAMRQWREKLAEPVLEQKFRQYLFYRQWGRLKEYANARGVRIIGDIPIFVSADSAEVWAHPGLFQLKADRTPQAVAGVPPDYFSATGQLWGNPLYDWERMKEDGFAWWISRLAHTLGQVDIVRIDHFRGFQAYWRIPAGQQTAVKGRWVEAPGREFFRTAGRRLGALPIIAEDLGLITPEVHALREALGFPGMKVLQFAFGEDELNPYLPHNYERNCVAYTGTHDNNTVTGWYRSAPEGTRDHVRRYLARDGHDIAWDFIRLAWSSVALLALTTPQDLLSMGKEGRMNLPSTAGGNWGWRLREGALTRDIAHRLAELTRLYRRDPVRERERREKETREKEEQEKEGRES